MKTSFVDNNIVQTLSFSSGYALFVLHQQIGTISFDLVSQYNTSSERSKIGKGHSTSNHPGGHGMVRRNSENVSLNSNWFPRDVF